MGVSLYLAIVEETIPAVLMLTLRTWIVRSIERSRLAFLISTIPRTVSIVLWNSFCPGEK